METIDYKARYKSIPVGYRNEVWDLVKCDKNMLSRWMNGEGVSANSVAKIEVYVSQVSKAHDLAKIINPNMKSKIIVEHPTAIEYIEYSDLMSFKIQLDDCVHDVNDIYELLGSAQDCIKNLWDKDPYDIKLLIAKWILR